MRRRRRRDRAWRMREMEQRGGTWYGGGGKQRGGENDMEGEGDDVEEERDDVEGKNGGNRGGQKRRMTRRGADR
jgi:hypothetical protein